MVPSSFVNSHSLLLFNLYRSSPFSHFYHGWDSLGLSLSQEGISFQEQFYKF